jgi:multidrug transporter EmrE-like cation transporter
MIKINKITTKIKDYVFLHLILLFYSLNSIISKVASQNPFLSFKFTIYFGIVVFNLLVYAFLWQKILKKMPLTTAFSNKSITIIWGMVWGLLFFKEQISMKMILGAVIIIIGVYLVVTDNE